METEAKTVVLDYKEISTQEALDGRFIVIVKYIPSDTGLNIVNVKQQIFGLGRSKEEAYQDAVRMIDRMKICNHLFVLKTDTREKRCRKCRFVIKEY